MTTTHTHPELVAQIEQVHKDLTSEIGASEDRVLSELAKVKSELKSDMAELKSDMAGLQADVKEIKAYLLGSQTP